MRTITKPFFLIFLSLIFLAVSGSSALANPADNPLVTPQEVSQFVDTGQNVINILLLGIDFGTNGYWGSGHKKEIENCHTDAVMVVSINAEQNRINLLSLPRDTVTYVPGVKGIYKLNAAINCADTLAEGLVKTKSAVELLLGNIKIDYYFAVDMNTMIALGDAIGGVDITLRMNYTGHSNTHYYKGLQHLNGIGMTDYLRARTNATVDYNDIGRTSRQREMMLAIFNKLRTNETMIWDLLNTAVTSYDGFYTDITAATMVKIALILPNILRVKEQEIGSYVFSGPYRNFDGWNFTFTDQDNRLAVIKKVFGISADPLPYVSYAYTQWLVDAGFSSVHYISVAQQLITFIENLDANSFTTPQQESYAAFMAAYREAVAAFNTAANTLSSSDTHQIAITRTALRKAADSCAQVFAYPGKLPWSHNRKYWFDDPCINEYQLDWR